MIEAQQASFDRLRTNGSGGVGRNERFWRIEKKLTVLHGKKLKVLHGKKLKVLHGRKRTVLDSESGYIYNKTTPFMLSASVTSDRSSPTQPNNNPKPLKKQRKTKNKS